jgi:hypothetical protein
MFRATHRFPKQLVAAIAVLALAVPATSAARVYENPPGTTDAQQGYVDHRSPDARAAAIEAKPEARAYTDLRSPDAKDAGRVAQSPPPVEVVDSPSFHWGDAGIGAGGVLGLLLIVLSVMFVVIHRRSRVAETQSGPAVTS